MKPRRSRDQRLDHGKFPDLMPQRFLIAAGKHCATTSTGFRFLSGTTDWHCSVGVNARSCLGCPGWAARLFAARFFLCAGLGMWMLGARRQRRIPGRLVDTRFQLRHLAHCQPRNRFRHLHKDRLGLRRNPIPKRLRRHPVHTPGVAEIVKLEKINLSRPRQTGA